MSHSHRSRRRLLVVHAHPDDECITTGGLLARYADEGALVCLVTCTDGELGEIAELPGIDPEAVRPRLADVRRRELSDACRALGVDDVRLLGYHDSGMAGTPENDAPDAFVNVDLGGVVARLAAILRDVRPQVVVTYDEGGLYGHPDHIKVNLAVAAALAAAADPARDPEAGPAWDASRLYYAVVPSRVLLDCRRRLLEAGQESPLLSEENIAAVGAEDESVHAQIDVLKYLDRKLAALRAHRTQWGTTRDFVTLPEPVRHLLLGREWFALARGSPPGPGVSGDLFDGLVD